MRIVRGKFMTWDKQLRDKFDLSPVAFYRTRRGLSRCLELFRPSLNCPPNTIPHKGLYPLRTSVLLSCNDGIFFLSLSDADDLLKQVAPFSCLLPVFSLQVTMQPNLGIPCTGSKSIFLDGFESTQSKEISS